MNAPNDEEIEALLAGLSPALPDEALMRRLRAARPRRTIPGPLFWLPPLAAAAAALALAFHGGSTPAARQAAPEITRPREEKRVPVASRQHLMEVADLGVVRDAGKQPVRLIRTTWLDEIYYITTPGEEPEKEARLREEVIPVALATY